MDVYFAHDDAALAGFRRSTGGGGVLYFGGKWTVLEALRKDGLPVVGEEELLDREEASAVDRFAHERAKDWYRDGEGEDFTLFRGVSLGWLYEYYLGSYRFVQIIKQARLARALIERERPSVVWMDDGRPPFLAAVLEQAQRDGPPSFMLRRVEGGSPGAGGVEGVMGPTFAWKSSLGGAKVLRERLFRFCYNGAAALSRLFRPRAPRRLLVSYYPTLRPVHDALLSREWRKEFDLTLLERPAPDLLGRCLRSGAPILQGDPSGNMPDVPRSLTAGDAARLEEIRSRWESLKGSAEYRRRFSFRGWAPWKPLEEALESQFFAALERTANWTAFLDEHFARQKTDAVLLPIDSMPRFQAVIGAARKRGVASTVVLHGTPGFDDGLVGLAADRAAVAGPELGKRLRRRGRPAEAVFEDACPQFDRYSGRPPSPSAASGGARKVLFLSQPYEFVSARAVVGDAERHVSGVAKVLSEFPGVKATLKVHPSENLEYYRGLLRDFPAIATVKDGDIDDLLVGHDLVLATASTVLVQAALLGRRIVLVDFTRLDYADPFKEGWGFPVARTPEALSGILRKELSPDPGPAQDQAALIRGFAGRGDGGGTRRLLERVSAAAGGAP